MLWTRILRAFLAIIVVALSVAGTTAALLYDKPPDAANAVKAIAEHIISDMPADEALPSALAVRADELSVHLALWNTDGSLIAQSGPSLPAPKEGRESHRWARTNDLRAMVIPLSDGRTLTVAVAHPDDLRWLRMILVMVMAFGVMGFGSYIIARRLTTRLEKLTSQVGNIHPEQLDTKVDVDGSDEVAALASAFNDSVSRIASLVDNQKHLLAMVSHELRSPLARIRMAVELMDGAEHTSRRDEICKNIEELDALIGDLLLASRLELQNETESKPFDISQIAVDEATRIGAAFEGTTAILHGDPRLARRAIRNLLENAKNHGSLPIAVSITVQGNQATICVDDSGDGIAQDQRERIFDPFYRPEGFQRGVSEGAGLRLYLVAQIAQAYRGSVTCGESPTGGARFLLCWPVVPQKEAVTTKN